MKLTDNYYFKTCIQTLVLLLLCSVILDAKYPDGFVNNGLNETILEFRPVSDVRIVINAPVSEFIHPERPFRLIFFATPNGNTIEHTAGRLIQPDEDWHYNIQHIAAQTRFLRENIPDINWILIYLQNDYLSWPKWRRETEQSGKLIHSFVDSCSRMFPADQQEIILSGHSGGGSFIFGYLNETDTIPDKINRITFLDSNYGYESDMSEKFRQWLGADTLHFLSVLAYNDSIALYQGKPFVSQYGGTWHRSHMMIRDLENSYHFIHLSDTCYDSFEALDGRIQFLMKHNPQRKIYHTVQVERNGFIQAMVSGTTFESKNYRYFGERAYTRWITP